MDAISKTNWLDTIQSQDEEYYNQMIDDVNIENKFYESYQQYYNFALSFVNIDVSNKIENVYIFKIPNYGDLISKMYLCFELPKLVPHKTSSWACWTNVIGFFIIDKVEVCINNIVIEEISGYSLYNEYIATTQKSKEVIYEKNIGLYHTDIELRENAKTTSKYIIPLHLFFSKSYVNAFPINKGKDFELRFHFIDKNKRCISSNMIYPEDYEDIYPKLDIEYVHLTELESSNMKSNELNYLVEIRNDINIPIYNRNKDSDISIIKHNLIEKYNNVSNLYTYDYHFEIFNNVIDYVEYILNNYPTNKDFLNYYLGNIIVDIPIAYTNAPNSDILTWIEINSKFNMFHNSSTFHYSHIHNYNLNIQDNLSQNLLDNFVDNGFNSMLYYGMDHSEQIYIKSAINSLSIDGIDFPSDNLNDFKIVLEDYYNTKNEELTKEITYYEKQKINIEQTWKSENSAYESGNVFFIQQNIAFLNNLNTNLGLILDNYSELKTNLENNETLPLVEYIQTYINDIKFFIQNVFESYKSNGYFDSYLNIFSFNNVLYENSNKIIYEPGNYHPNCFSFYLNNPNCNVFIPIIDDYPPAGPPPEYEIEDKNISSLERVLLNKSFVYNSVPFQYFVHKIEELIEPLTNYIEHIDKDNIINLYDYSKSIEIINGLNNILNVREQNTNETQFQNIQSNIHESISDVLKQVITEQQDDFIKSAINPQIQYNLDTISCVTKYIFSITTDIIPNCFDDFYNDTIYTLLQYKNEGFNSSNIMDDVTSYLPIIHIMEDTYDSFDKICGSLSEVMTLVDQDDPNSNMKTFAIVRNLIHSENDEFNIFLLKNEFGNMNSINFEKSYQTLNSERLNCEYSIEKLWLDEFELIKNNYSDDVARKHIDRHLEHIRGQKYNVQEYVHNISLNLIEVYKELLKIDFNNENGLNYTIQSNLLMGIMKKMYKKRQNIIFFDTFVYNMKQFSNDFLKSVSYPIKIENMNISNKVYSNLLNDINNQIQSNIDKINKNNEIVNNIQIIDENINDIEDDFEKLQSVLNLIDDLEYSNYNLNLYKFNTIDANIINRIKSIIDRLYTLYTGDYNAYLLNAEENKNNEVINNTRLQILENISRYKQINISQHKLFFDFNLIQREPIKVIWFSIHQYEKYKTKNYFSQLEYDDISVEKVVISVNENIEQTIFTSDDMTILKPYFYSKKVYNNEVYCIPFCINTESILPSGSFHPMKKNNDLKIHIIINARVKSNIVVNMNAVQWKSLKI